MVQVSSAGRAYDLYLCAVTDDGGLWMTIRQANGHWAPFIDVRQRARSRGHFTDVDVAIVNGEMHVCGITNDGHLWHAIRRDDTSWAAFEDIETNAGDRGSFVSVATAGGFFGGSSLQVAGVTSDGRLWHTILQARSGSWSPFEDVEAAAGEQGSFASVGVGGYTVIP